jgi:hypothetical protein
MSDESAGDTALKIWSGVPGGAVLEVSLASTAETWAGGARLIVSHPDGFRTEEMWGHADLHPGPKQRALEAPNGYTVRVRVGFAGSDQVWVTIAARIIKPDGSQFGSGYSYLVSGRSPEVERATIIAVTKKSDR